MSTFSRSAHRSAVSVTVAAVLGITAAGIGHAAGGSSNHAATPMLDAVVALAPSMNAGSELRFIALPPCRILDTRYGGGVLVSGSRTFTATGSLTAQGGNAAGCDVPSTSAAVQLSLGALSDAGGNGYLTAWKTGTTKPLASAVNYNTSGPTSTLATVELSATGQFNIYTNSRAHVFADVTGYWTKPLYAVLSPDGTAYNGMFSGVVSVAHPSTGVYIIDFERSVRGCSAQGTELLFAGSRDVSVDNTYEAENTTVRVVVTNNGNEVEDTYVSISLTC